MKRSVHLLARGRVQGVGFRWFAQREAARRGLAGWVRNLSGGDVEAWAEGEELAVRDWLERLREGPSGARVEHLLTVWGAPAGGAVFEMRPTAPAQEPFQ